ncbi:unnamed protein product, partial [Heterotrigona itama]
MSASKTKKPRLWPYFDHTDCDKTFSKAVCKFCDYTHYCTHTSILCNHLPQNKHEIIQLEADSKNSNPSVSSHNHIQKTTADNKQITHHKDKSIVEMNSSSSNSNSSSHNCEQGIVVGDNKQSSLSQTIPKDAYIFSMQNNQRVLKFMKLFDERYTSLDIDDLRRNYFLRKTLASARFIHLTINLLWFVINSYSRIKNKVMHDVLFIAPCQVENSFEHVCCCVLEIAKIYNITHKIKIVVLDDENCMSYFAKGKEASIKNWKIFFHFKHTLMNIVNSAIHNSGTILLSIVTMKKLLYDIVNQENSSHHTPIDERMNKYLDIYIKEKPIETDSNPISWWDREGCQLFPLLSSFAFEYLSILVVPTSTSKQ